ncbi:MAG: hypothetical protein HY800_09495 [Ignavibacteriales bacterium]|nr:hypothetical protein [Ignavibacteriales bacterium]
MNAIDILKKFSLSIKQLEGQIDAQSNSEFECQFREFFSTPTAKSAANCAYVWYTQKPILRLKDSSDIIYIGETIQSLHARYSRYAAVEASDSNFARYYHIISNFGPIKVYYYECDKPKDREREMLKMYFQNHLEIPPLNRKS